MDVALGRGIRSVIVVVYTIGLREDSFTGTQLKDCVYGPYYFEQSKSLE